MLCLLVYAIEQIDSVLYIYIYIYSFFIFFSIMVYYRILNISIVPCAIQ